MSKEDKASHRKLCVKVAPKVRILKYILILATFALFIERLVFFIYVFCCSLYTQSVELTTNNKQDFSDPVTVPGQRKRI